MLYRIAILGEGPCAGSYARKRSDAADYLLRTLTYRIIEGNGGLDTQQGHATMRRAEDLDVTRGGTFTAYNYTVIVTASKGGA